MTVLFGVPGLFWRKTTSSVFILVFVLLSLFVWPMCACPWYYIELSAMGLVPLICGPRLYRWLGCGVIAIGLLRAWTDSDALVHQKQEQIRMQREAEAHMQHQ